MNRESIYIKPLPLSRFSEPYYGSNMLHYMLQKNNYMLLLKIAEYKQLDAIDTEELLMKYWKPKYFVPNIEN